MKEIRNATGLSQRAFAEKYHIPLQTLKQWESRKCSKSYRKPPEYVEYLLRKMVDGEYAECFMQKTVSTESDPLINAAKHSYGNAEHWFRYLRKEFNEEECRITGDRLRKLLACEELSMFQKVSLKQAVINGSPTNQYVITLNKRAQTPMMDVLRKKYNNV